MNRKNSQFYEVLTRAVDFGTRNVSLFPGNSAIAELLETLESGRKTLAEQDAIRVSADTNVRIGRTVQDEARETLKGYILKAGQLSKITHSDNIRVPANSTRRALIEAANAFIRNAGSMKKDFVALGLPENFPEVIRGAVEELESANLEYSKAKALKSQAMERFAIAKEEAVEALHRFDILARNVLENNPGALASYESARTIEHTRGRGKTTEEAKANAAAA
jgi:hypothetical protein